MQTAVPPNYEVDLNITTNILASKFSLCQAVLVLRVSVRQTYSQNCTAEHILTV